MCFMFKNKLNPGTTADLTASSIMVSYLADYL
jgi:triphosphoribosyl-dephospho-CoA synthase